MKPFKWTCPFCGHAQTVVQPNHSYSLAPIETTESKYGRVGLISNAIACANPDCEELLLSVRLHYVEHRHRVGWTTKELIESWMLRPESSARPQGKHIPAPIVDNYSQACRIRDLSANASATMARRCLQGMIRDFCGVAKATLNAEIDELKKQVEEGHAPRGVLHDHIDAIDAVRQLGNIGAHMESDINLILDVDSGEAQALIDLIEALFEEWYDARKVREERFQKVGLIANGKKEKKQQAKLVAAEQSKALPAPDREVEEVAVDVDSGNLT